MGKNVIFIFLGMGGFWKIWKIPYFFFEGFPNSMVKNLNQNLLVLIPYNWDNHGRIYLEN